MAVPRFAPIVLLDGIIREVTERTFTDPDTGQVMYRGRKAILQTSRGFVEVVVTPDDDVVALTEESRLTVFAELSEWKMANGNAGSTLTFAAHVTREHLAEMASGLPEPVKQAPVKADA